MAGLTSRMNDRKRVTFELQAESTNVVCLAGTFNDWDPTAKQLKHVDGNGQCRTTLMLPKGRYEYKFVIDGNWRTDPQNHDLATDEQGTENSVLVVS